MKSGAETKTIIAAGETLQALTPTRIAAAFYPDTAAIETQRALAEILDCSTTTVSNSLKTLSKLPVPIVSKDRSKYTVTPKGETILGLLSQTTKSLGVDLYSVEWDSETDMSELADCLDPLHTSSSPLMFFVLYSIGCRSSVGEQLNLLHAPKQIQKSDIERDVEKQKAATNKQIWYRLDRLDSAGSIEFEGDVITLTKKGEAQLRLFEQVLRSLEHQHSETQQPSRTTESTDEPHTPPIPQHSSQTSVHGNEIVVSLDGDSEAATLAPAYCVDGQPLLSLSSSETLEELAQKISDLGHEIDATQTLELQWTLRTDPSRDSRSRQQKH